MRKKSREVAPELLEIKRRLEQLEAEVKVLFERTRVVARAVAATPEGVPRYDREGEELR